jgi:hypothetical protein
MSSESVDAVTKELTLAVMNKFDIKSEQTMQEYTNEIVKIYKNIYQTVNNPNK